VAVITVCIFYSLELFDSEVDAALAYDRAVERLKPNLALTYMNFKVNIVL
jgi:hypothetical protein